MTPEQLGSATPEIYRSLMLHVTNILRAGETEEEEEEGEEEEQGEEEFVEPGEALVRFEPLNPPTTPSVEDTTGRTRPSRPRGQPTPEEIRLRRPDRDKRNIARPRTRSAFRTMERADLIEVYNRFYRDRFGVSPTFDNETTAEDLAEEILTMY
eukprot:scaffold16370_cov141-Isochrysis_galbana.AAC.2